MTGANSRRGSWAQPSLSRDFALLSAAIVFIMLLISAWVAWITYIKHSERITFELQKEASRIERTLETEIQATGYLLTAIGRQIAAHDPEDRKWIAQMMLNFSSGNPFYALWSWTDPTGHLTVSSNKGVLDEPVDVSDRDYIQKGQREPWVQHIGVPIEGRVSGRWVIPISVGVTDDTGKFIGTLAASVDINTLTAQISHIVRRDGISFAVLSKAFIPLTIVSDSDSFVINDLPLEKLKGADLDVEESGVMSKAGLFSRSDIYSYFFISGKYPYIIIVGYDAQTSDSAIRALLWPRIIQIIVVAVFLLSFLGIIRSRVIKPVVELSVIAGQVANGGRYHPLSKAGPQEIEMLSDQVGRISEYIAERKLVEEELRAKIGMQQQRQQSLQMEIRQRAAMLAGLLGEYKKSLRSINNFAQVLKDQLYGPIDNKKYRQYAADIHQTGTTLELMVRKLIALSRVDSAAVVMRDEPAKLRTLLESARRFAQEALENRGELTFNALDENVPDAVLQVDGLTMQQAIAYLMLYLASQDSVIKDIRLSSLRLPAQKGEESLVLLFGRSNNEPLSAETVQQALKGGDYELPVPPEDTLMEYLHLTLAQAMLRVQHIRVVPSSSLETGTWVIVQIPPERIVTGRHQEEAA